MEETTVQLGNATAVRTTAPDGTQSFRLKPEDTVQIEITMLDNVGRTRVVIGYDSTMLIIVPVDPFGALVFDRHPVADARDENGRVVFMQRPVMSREETFELASQIAQQNASRVAIHPATAIPGRRILA